MKYYSEIVKKHFDSAKECLQAEKNYAIAQEELKARIEAEKQERLKKEEEVATTKKEHAKTIEKLQASVDEAYSLYEIARNEAKDVLDKSNKLVEEILKTAEDRIKNAEKEKLDSVKDFNSKYGAYTYKVNSIDATDEFNRVVNLFNKIFKFW